MLQVDDPLARSQWKSGLIICEERELLEDTNGKQGGEAMTFCRDFSNLASPVLNPKLLGDSWPGRGG